MPKNINTYKYQRMFYLHTKYDQFCSAFATVILSHSHTDFMYAVLY